MCKFFNGYEESLHKVYINLQNMYETALFSGKIYTADKNITRPPVATNFKSGCALPKMLPTISQAFLVQFC